MKLNEKIYTCRKQLGISQEELAIRIGVSRQSISKWEIGEASPEINKLPLLAKEFNVSTDWLLSDDDPVESNHTTYDHHTEVVFPSWVEKLPKSILGMVKRFGWIYGLIMAGEGLLFSGVGLLARTMFKTMILGNNNIVIEGDLPQHVLNSLLMDPSYGFYDSFTLNAWKMASMFTGLVIGIGLIFVILGIILAITLRKWGKKQTEEF